MHKMTQDSDILEKIRSMPTDKREMLFDFLENSEFGYGNPKEAERELSQRIAIRRILRPAVTN